MAYLPGYSKYKVLTLTGGASGALSNHQLKLAVAYEAAMQGDFDDIRFTQADGDTLIDAWAELIVTDTSATVWAEFPSTPANTVEQTYRMYYGNAGAANYWDGPATFLKFDDFEDALQGDWITADAPVDYDSTNDYFTGSQSMEIGASGNTGHAYISHTHSDDIALSFRVKTTTTSMFATWWGDGDAFIYPALMDDDIRYYYGGWQGTETLAHGSWYKITFKNFDWSANTYDICVGDNETVIYSGAAMHSSSAYNDTIRLYSEGKSYVDDLYVRKYAANPPTYEFGAEQSVPTGAIMNQFQKANMGADLYNGAIIA